jgi:hypothetical protein
MATKGKSWFQIGEEGEKRAVLEDKKAKARRDSSPWSFRLKNGENGFIIWLDTPKFYCSIHTVKDGRAYKTETCLGDFDTCPICEQGNNAAYVMVGTVIDRRSFDKKDGSGVVKDQKRLFIAKAKARSVLQRRVKAQGGDIKFCLFQAFRGNSPTECATGEDFEFKKRVSEAAIRKLCPAGEDVEKWIKPFDYKEIFAPKTSKELRQQYGGETPVGAESESDFPDADMDDLEESTGEDSLLDDLDEATSGADDLLSDLDEPEEKAPEFDEDALKKELVALAKAKGVEGLKNLKKYCTDNDIEIRITKASKKSDVVREIIDALRPEEAAELEEEDAPKEEDDLDIDDLI